MFFFLATGVTPAMDTQVVGEGSTYPWTAVDADNNPFDGGKNYKLHLPPQYPGQDVLVGHRLRHPDPVDVANRPAVPEREQPEQESCR